MNHIVLTTSFPAFSGDSSGHFVQTEAIELSKHGTVSILAAGLGRSDFVPPMQCELTWLGGASLFGSPGALERIKRSPWALRALPGVLIRAHRRLGTARGSLFAHWIVPFGYLAARVQNARSSGNRFDSLEVIAHGSDVRLLLACPRLIRDRVIRELLRANAKLRFVSAELRAQLAHSLRGALAEFVGAAEVRPAALGLPAGLPSREQARRDLGLAPDARVLLFVGRLIAGKRPSEALVSACLVPGAEVHCIGDGPKRDSLQARFPEVRFLGQVSRELCLAWIRAADVLISASRHEGSPGAVREALALGTSVVAVPAGDLRERARSEVNLHLVDEGLEK